jgi:hypothetical protein
MDNQHKLVKGYRDLTQEEINVMNEIKALEARWNGLVDRLKTIQDIDMRNVSLAVTYCEDGFSRAVRAVARPQRIVDNGSE